MKKTICINKDPNIKVSSQIVSFMLPPSVFLPISKDAKIMFASKKVVKGEALFKDEHNTTFSPISGTVEKIVPINDKYYLKINNDYLENDSYKGTAELTTIRIRTDFAEKVKEYPFYSWDRFTGKKILVLNGIEDEPYVACKMMIHKTYKKEIITMLDVLREAFKLEKVFICLKENDRESIEAFMGYIDTYPAISLKILNDTYPLEDNSILKETLNLKDEVFLSTQEVYDMYADIIKERKRDISFVTFTGDAIKPFVLQVKKGTPLENVIENENIQIDEYTEVYLNSLLHGHLVNIKEVYLNDDTHALYFMKKKSVKEIPCIHCGKCVEVCPFNCNPYIAYLKRNKVVDKKCSECGLCTYICPSHISLSDWIRGDDNV